MNEWNKMIQRMIETAPRPLHLTTKRELADHIAASLDGLPSGAAGPPSDEAPATGRDWYDEVLRLRAALASAEQRARTQALQEALGACERARAKQPWAAHIAYDQCKDAIRALGASPEGRGSATP
jgi:hypothetical protein